MGRVCGLCLERLYNNFLDPVIADLARRAASGFVVQAIKADALRTDRATAGQSGG
jgi:hypothetical protein